MRDWLYRFGLYFAWFLATIATIGSLFFSDVLYFEPCSLCWYQRICLFPLAIILGLAAYDKNHYVVRYVLPLPILGSLFALYQILQQRIPGFSPINLCGAGPHCDEDPLMLFGFLSIAMLAFAGFLAVTFFLVCARPRAEKKRTR
ncbi:MAG: disulfide bond formation protein B [Chlamydiia bacterium]